MYEGHTFEVILRRMLDRVSSDLDKRPGSIIYDALAPAAAEVAQMYAELELNRNLSYADTASGEYLERRASEFGVNRRRATKARRKGLFHGDGHVPLDVPMGSRYSISGMVYAVISKLAIGEYVMECETAGIIGNQQFGAMLPIEFIPGLVRAELADVLAPGEDEESDEQLRQRYYAIVNEPAFGGNVSDYRQKIDNMQGVGGVKVVPVWQGGGTVKCTIIASDYSVPAPELVEEVQTTVDPLMHRGEGMGLAPIGHVVTIAGATSEVISLETTVALEAGRTIGQVQADIEAAFEEYLLSLRRTWAEQEKIIVRTAQVESRILTVQGIVDVTDTKLNGVAANVELGPEEIPVAGAVTLNE